MNKPTIFLTILTLFLAACSNSQPSSTAQVQPTQSDATAADNTAPASTQDPNADMPVPPPDAMFTLHCATFTGLTHIEDARRVKELMIRSTSSRQWYVVHSSDESDLYYGFYKTFDDRSQLAEFNRAQSDRARIASLVNDEGDALFPDVIFTSINTPDPPAPKEWDLSHNPGYWTLQIAVYRGSPLRKQMAVDAVKGFRAEGVEAYYRHGPNTSEVYIGSWARQAVEEQEAASAQSDDPNEPLLILPGPPPKGVDPDNVHDAQGRKMKVVMPQLNIVDDSLKRATQQYPYYYVNGVVAGRKLQMKDGSWQTIPWPSYLVQVPHDNPPDQDDADNQNLGQSPAPSQGDTGGSPDVPGLGGLR